MFAKLTKRNNRRNEFQRNFLYTLTPLKLDDTMC